MVQNAVCLTGPVRHRASFPALARPRILSQRRAQLLLHQTAWQLPEVVEKQLKAVTSWFTFLTQSPFRLSSYL